VGDREILETYLNSASKNTAETDIFPHGTKSLLTSVISVLLKPVPFEERIVLSWSALTVRLTQVSGLYNLQHLTIRNIKYV